MEPTEKQPAVPAALHPEDAFDEMLRPVDVEIRGLTDDRYYDLSLSYRAQDQNVEIRGLADDRYYWLSALSVEIGNVAESTVRSSRGEPEHHDLRLRLIVAASICVCWIEHYTGNTTAEILHRIKAHGPRVVTPDEPMIARLLGDFSAVVKQVRTPNNPVGARNELVTMCRTLKAWWQQEDAAVKARPEEAMAARQVNRDVHDE